LFLPSAKSPKPRHPERSCSQLHREQRSRRTPIRSNPPLPPEPFYLRSVCCRCLFSFVPQTAGYPIHAVSPHEWAFARMREPLSFNQPTHIYLHISWINNDIQKSSSNSPVKSLVNPHKRKKSHELTQNKRDLSLSKLAYEFLSILYNGHSDQTKKPRPKAGASSCRKQVQTEVKT